MKNKHVGLKLYYNNKWYITSEEECEEGGNPCQGCAFNYHIEGNETTECADIKKLYFRDDRFCADDHAIIYKKFDQIKGKKKLLIL